ncbi:glycosyltransferase family 2 protein [Demequina salsinemoris]|uniref:glycosyltransferase family 2 protein n=1 Tax=Demequina salsinemoris TaxID=577470 RepID=UPI00078040BB|nr:glycosyltransferase family 2 protein [Demequina salsinemoris]
MDQLAVLIPCYNEAQTIEKVVTDCREQMPEATVYVYDNNSTDATAGLARNAGAVVRTERLQGKGNVIRRMFREIDAECYIMLDGDDTYPAEHLRELAAPIQSGEYEMVVGDRLSSTYFEENKRPFHNVGNVSVRWFVNRLFGADVRDVMTGYRAFSYTFVKSFPVISRGFEIETEMTIHAANHNMGIAHVEVEYRDRPEDSHSKLSTFSDGFRVLGTLFTLFKDLQPMRFFSAIAAVLIGVPLLVLIPTVMVPYARTGEVENFPTLIVCGFIGLVGVLAFMVGAILDTASKNYNKNFELHLLRVQHEYRNLPEENAGR